MNNPLKYTDPSGWCYSFDKPAENNPQANWEVFWHNYIAEHTTLDFQPFNTPQDPWNYGSPTNADRALWNQTGMSNEDWMYTSNPNHTPLLDFTYQSGKEMGNFRPGILTELLTDLGDLMSSFRDRDFSIYNYSTSTGTYYYAMDNSDCKNGGQFFHDGSTAYSIGESAAGGGDTPYSLYFDGNRLMVVNENTGSVPYSTRATSGSGSNMNNSKSQNVPNGGIIPQGVYSFKNTGWDHLNIFQQAKRLVTFSGDLGEYNVRLTPLTYTGSRSDFFIHGGYLDGSHGCIDAGLNVDKIYNYVKSQDVTILRVRY